MAVAPPQAPESRVRELGDSIVVEFRPRREWGTIVFFTVWLSGWTAAGIFVIYSLSRTRHWYETAFLLLWLCMWGAALVGAAAALGRQLAGRDVVTATPDGVEVRRHIGRWARTHHYHQVFVTGVTAARVPPDGDGETRDDFGLEIAHRDEEVHVGEGMTEAEAEEVAGAIWRRLRPPTWWDGAAL